MNPCGSVSPAPGGGLATCVAGPLAGPTGTAAAAAPLGTRGVYWGITRAVLAAPDDLTGRPGRDGVGTAGAAAAIRASGDTGALAVAARADDFAMTRRMTSLSCCTSKAVAVRR